MIFLLMAIVGAILAIPLVLIVRSQRADLRLLLYAAALILAALVYVGFAVRTWSPGPIALESAGVVIYGAVALAGWRRSGVLLAIGWAAHVAWDFGVPRPALDYVPSWYPPLCSGFDLFVASAVLLAARKRQPASKAHSAGLAS